MSDPQQFRKRPVVVEAWQWDGEPLREGDPDWVAEATEPVFIVGLSGCGMVGMTINTLEGKLKVRPNDWIIRGIKGEVYSCRADIFAETHEPAMLQAAPTPPPLPSEALEEMASVIDPEAFAPAVRYLPVNEGDGGSWALRRAEATGKARAILTLLQRGR